MNFRHKKNLFFILILTILLQGTPEISNAALTTNIKIDANNVLIPYVEPAILGGNSVSNRVWDYYFDIYKELGEVGKNVGGNFNKPWWRIHWLDAGLNQDVGMFNKDFYKRDNGLSNPMITEDDKQFNWLMQYPSILMDITYNKGPKGEDNKNYWEIEWFDRSPMYENYPGISNRHAISYTKFPGSYDQKHRHIPREASTPDLPNGDAFYRFDLKISSEIPYQIQEGAYIMGSTRFRLFLNPDKSLKVVTGSRDNEAILIEKTKILDFDKWYAIEIKAAHNSEIWMDGVKISENVLNADQIKSIRDEDWKSPEINVGTLIYEGKKQQHSKDSQLNDSYKFKIDELEIRTKYAGSNPKHPLDQTMKNKFIDEVIIAHSYDHGLHTLDDFGAQSEKLNFELVFGLINPCMKKYGCEKDTLTGKFARIHSVEGQAAMIQYMVSEEDSNFQEKAKEIIDSNFPVNDLNKYNYANLRAYRGRKEPYKLRYVEVGNEPYYQGYNKNPEGFAQFYIDQCRAIKKIKSDLQCIIPGQGDYYEKVLKKFMEIAKGEGLISGVATHDYFLHTKPNGEYYNNRTESFLRTMAGPFADNYYRYQYVKGLNEKYLKDEPDYKNLFYLSNEYSSILRNYKQEVPDKFVDAAMTWSELAYLLENGFRAGASFVWNSASWGEGFAHGLVGDYNKIPKLNLNGEVFQNYARHFGWGGKVLKTEYDNLIKADPISKLNVPQTTVISSISSDNKKLFISIINRSNEDLNSTFDIANFSVGTQGRSFVLDASNIMDSHEKIHFTQKTFNANKQFNYNAPALSISFLELDREGNTPPPPP